MMTTIRACCCCVVLWGRSGEWAVGERLETEKTQKYFFVKKLNRLKSLVLNKKLDLCTWNFDICFFT